MPAKTFKALVARFGGWIEGGTAYFPSVYQRVQFEKASQEFEERAQ